jgi:hypothetical protein
MFRAAAIVGPATRPLLVFYGLNQAGRAVTLSFLWDCIPENRSAPLGAEEATSRRCPLLVDTQRMHGESHPLALVCTSAATPN